MTKTATPKPAKPTAAASVERVYRPIKFELRAQPANGAPDAERLPDGVCGRLTGVALTYNVPDDYGTIFMPGCLAKTRTERVAPGRVKLFADHGPFTDTHVGVVRSLDDVGDAVVMTADLFDTESGRAMKEYLDAVLASGADTGLSIGFRPHDKEWRKLDSKNDEMFLFFKEIEVREVSITPVPAVPGTDVTSVRREPGENDEDLLKRVLTNILRALPERDARAVFDTVYASSAAKPDTTDGTPPKAAEKAAGSDAVSAESATGTEVEADERLRFAREVFVA